MKKLFYLLLIPLFVISCSSDDDDDSNQLPIENLKLPESSESAPIKNSETITINGKGFLSSDQIWFITATKSTGDKDPDFKKGEIKEVTDTYIKVMPPEVYGKQKLTIIRDKKEYNMGNVYFEAKELKKRMTKYMHSNDEDHDYYTFEYNASGLLSKITDGDDDGVHSVTELTYEDGMLVKITETETGDTPEIYNISYNNENISVKYNKTENGVAKELEDIITLDEDGNPVRIKYTEKYCNDFTYDTNGNISIISAYYDGPNDYRTDYTYTYDDKASFISNMNVPAWFWLYGRLDMDLGCGLVNNILKENNVDLYSYTYNSEGYPSTIKDLKDEDDLEIAITYESF